MTTAGKERFAPYTEEEAIEYVTAPIKRNPDLPFYIFATAGDPEVDAVPMHEQMRYLSRREEFSYGTDTTKNNLYFSVSEFHHDDILVPFYYWNSLKVLFYL